MNYKTIFIYANAYAARTLTFYADYLFNFRVSGICLLRENHKETEDFSLSSEIHITLCNNIIDAIEASDINIALWDENTPQVKLNDIIRLSNELGKECIVIENPWQKEQYGEQHKFYVTDTLSEYANKPIILSMSIGQFSEHYCIELLLNKIFSDEGIEFYQEYTIDTENLILQMSKYGIVNGNVLKHSFSHHCNQSIMIKSIRAEDLFDLNEEKNFLGNIHPDYFILACESDFKGLDELEKLLWYKYGVKNDLTVVSPYLLFEKYEKAYTAIYCPDWSSSAVTRHIKNYDKNFEEKIKQSIFSKISIPLGIKIIE